MVAFNNQRHRSRRQCLHDLGLATSRLVRAVGHDPTARAPGPGRDLFPAAAPSPETETRALPLVEMVGTVTVAAGAGAGVEAEATPEAIAGHHEA